MARRTDPLKELLGVRQTKINTAAILKHTFAPVSTQIEAIGCGVHETVA